MNERVEAAEKAYRAECASPKSDSFMAAALAAADAVMFQALKELAASWDYEWNNCEPGDQAAFGKSLAADELRAVVAALKWAGDE